MAIYGTPITMGGGGGSNDTLPPLLDGFKATRLEGGIVPPTANTLAFKDIPDGSKIKLVKGSKISGTVTYGTTTDLNHRIVFDSNDWTRKRFQLENDSSHNNISGSDIDQWLNATKASGWWTNQSTNTTSPDYSNEQGFLYQLGITDELLVQNFNDININATAKAKVALPWRVSFSEDIPYTFFKDVTFLDVADYASLYGNSGNDVLVYNKPQTKAPSQITLYNVTAKIHPMMEPKPETKVALDSDGTYFMFEKQTSIVLSADKMPVSRANALAGAVWVYGEHEPKNVNDGTKIELTRDEIVGESGNVQKEITEWDTSKDLYARQFTYNAKKHYQTSMAGAVAFLSRPTLRIGDLPSKSVVRLGRYEGNELTWWTTKDVKLDQYLILSLESASISDFKGIEFDNKEPSNQDTTRQAYGNNNYVLSNTHQWLNSAGVANAWYIAQHSADAEPTFANKAGFLNQWNDKEKSVLVNKEWSVKKPNLDGGGISKFYAKVVLPSATELAIKADTEGTPLDVFNSDSDRIVANSYYYSRSPVVDNPVNVYAVSDNGKVFNQPAFSRGTQKPTVRPIVSISPDTPVYEQPNEDGSYNICLTSPDDFESASSKVYVYSDTAPTNKSLMWIQKGSNVLYVHNGTNWMPITGVYGGGN